MLEAVISRYAQNMNELLDRLKFNFSEASSSDVPSERGFGLDERMFPTPQAMRKAYCRTRRHLAKKLHESELMKIRLYDFRHYYATMLYQKTKDILYVKEQLGHKRIETTLIYTHLIRFSDDEYVSAVAETVVDARKLIEAGFEYVTDCDNAKIFRKPK